ADRRKIREFGEWISHLSKSFFDEQAGRIAPAGYPISWNTGEFPGIIKKFPERSSGMSASGVTDTKTSMGEGGDAGTELVAHSSIVTQLSLPATEPLNCSAPTR